MKKLLSLASCLVILAASQAQSDSMPAKKQKSFMTTIRTLDNRIIKGQIASLNDSQLILRSFHGETIVSSENIGSFTMKRKKSVLKGMLIGFGVGVTTGVLIGLASGDDQKVPYPDASSDPFGIGSVLVSFQNAFALTAGQKALAAGIGMGTTGAIVGAVIGAIAKKKFIIGGRKEKFRDLQSQVMMKLVKK